MSSEDQTAVPNASDETEPNVEATEQSTENNYADTLLALAREDGHAVGDEPPKAEEETDEPEAEVPEQEQDAETQPVEAEAEED